MRVNQYAWIAVLGLGAFACGGGGSSSSSGVTTPSGPSQASITITRTSRGQIGLSPLAAFNYRILIPLRISESAGLGANINFARTSFTRSGVEIERAEIGASDIISSLGSNRLTASGQVSGNFLFDFNSLNWDAIVLRVNFTDDRNNQLEARLDMTILDFDLAAAAAARQATLQAR